MDMVMMVVIFAFLIETVVEILKPLLNRLEGVGDKLGIEMAYLASIA